MMMSKIGMQEKSVWSCTHGDYTSQASAYIYIYIRTCMENVEMHIQYVV